MSDYWEGGQCSAVAQGASQLQNRRRCSVIPLSPAPTPRSSQRAARDSLVFLGNSSAKNDKGVNVQVILRCRPLNEEEIQLKSSVVVSCNESKGIVSMVHNTAYKQIDRTFLFDKVFGPTSQQEELYDSAVSPIVNEVLEGYNCTIFAYGQTGTGKTYTMEGGCAAKNGELPSDAGIIPRAVKQTFDILEARNDDYSMKVTFVQIYNEEIMDLLAQDESPNMDDKSKKPIVLMEDGRGSVFIRGLEQEVVCTANEIYKILEKGSAKRRTVDTLINKQSSRSHTIFSITIYIKEVSSEGEELIKCGKLNLVDLAGSENMLRSGAREGRCRETGEINKSLLTLGRVINALVEHSGHVPYRDSKLTRLLRDSLGGKTKTCIIATISPSIYSLDETLSTLDYAHRAKNIKNKPEVNQRLLKSELLKDLYAEIDQLRQEVYAAREKNGIYIPESRYLNKEAERKAMAEKLKNMELDLEFKDKQFMEVQKLYNDQQQSTSELSEKLQQTRKEIEQTQKTFFELEERHKKANATIQEKDYLICNLLQSEKALIRQASELQAELEIAALETSGLFAKIEQLDELEDWNKHLSEKLQTELTQQLEILHKSVEASASEQEQQLKAMGEKLHFSLSQNARAAEKLLGDIGKLKDIYVSGIKSLNDIAGELDRSSQLALENVTTDVSKNSSALMDLLEEKFLEIDSILDDVKSDLFRQEEKLVEYALQQREGHSRTLQMTRSVSEVMMKFFETLSMRTTNLSQMAEETQLKNRQKLYNLEKEYEECVALEKKQFLEMVAELLETSNARRKKLVENAIIGLLATSDSETCKLQQEVSSLQDFAYSVNSKWATQMKTMETHYLDSTAKMKSRMDALEYVLQQGMAKARMGAQQGRNVQESVHGIHKRNIDSADSIAKKGIDANGMILVKFNSVASATLEEADIANKSLLSSIESVSDAQKIDSIIAPCFEDMKEMRNNHYLRALKIKENAGQHMVEECKMDKPYVMTVKKRLFNIPNAASIEKIQAPTFKELLTKFWGDTSSGQESGDLKVLSGTSESSHSKSHSRVPLKAVN